MKKRNSCIELLRIISMIFITLSHYSIHSGVVYSSMKIGINRFIMESLMLGNVGVIIFMLITGYYNIKKEKPFSFKKILLLYLQVLFYSIAIYFMSILLGIQHFSLKTLLINIFPITFNSYWFMTVYFLIYIFSIYINKIINTLNRKMNLSFLVTGFIIFSLISTLSTQNNYSNGLIQLFFFYYLGAYIGKYKNSVFYKKKYILLSLIVSITIICFSIIIFDIVGIYIPFISEHSTYFLSRTSPLCIILSTSIFCVFIIKKRFESRLINYISSCVTAVYLITDNNYVRNIIWSKIFKVPNYINTNYLLLHAFITIILVFITCIVVESIRRGLLNKINKKICDMLENKIENFLNKTLDNYIEE